MNIRGRTFTVESCRASLKRSGPSRKTGLVRGGRNVYRDLGKWNADVEQVKAILASIIIKAMDREGLTVRAAHQRTGTSAADFSRIRNAILGRFTVDRLMAIIDRLGSRVEIEIRERRRESTAGVVTA